MANVILTSHGSVSLPDPPAEGAVMPDAPDFPRIYYSATEATGRIFDTKADLDAARSDGPWFKTPTEAVDAAAKAATPEPTSEGEHTPPRSRR